MTDQIVAQGAARLLSSAARLSRDPATEIDWDAEPADLYGLSPEWSTLYGTAYWAELSEDQRRELTRHEAASVASTGIWFELILQQLILRDVYSADPAGSEFQWALTEVADECRHSIMFARATGKLGTPIYRPSPLTRELGRLFKTLAGGESAYAAILVAEEVLDVMQRDWMRDPRVVPLIRQVNNIHVVEESRHMMFARDETRQALAGAGRARRWTSALVISIAASVIVNAMVNPAVYANAGLNSARALREAAGNEHHRALLRSSCAGLMEFLGSTGLLTGPAVRVYRRVGLI
ncbi:para-aminobenzoate N-oxygenase AurF [Kribbella voronezhensis]|uniref:Para-aminobenzoate N-oxygenase AurF n=1 Tax=Kribbella voronezhensis TaxID=2512212 RepID=A0A4R7SXT8_9ACTN|nr:diiron oxygenase [Kribbella voronezhensis]TDU83739.1 para-aminobenzoate N-oxygenase AurF [Kribbella voronezhensis]